MIKKITKLGNSQGIIFDNTIMELAKLKVGDEMNLEVHDSGGMTLMPMERQVIDPATASDVAKRLISKNNELFRRLS